MTSRRIRLDLPCPSHIVLNEQNPDGAHCPGCGDTGWVELAEQAREFGQVYDQVLPCKWCEIGITIATGHQKRHPHYRQDYGWADIYATGIPGKPVSPEKAKEYAATIIAALRGMEARNADLKAPVPSLQRRGFGDRSPIEFSPEEQRLINERIVQASVEAAKANHQPLEELPP